MTSLRLANCSMFVPRRRETLGRRQWTVVFKVKRHPMPTSTMTAGVVDRESWQPVEGRRPNQPVGQPNPRTTFSHSEILDTPADRRSQKSSYSVACARDCGVQNANVARNEGFAVDDPRAAFTGRIRLYRVRPGADAGNRGGVGSQSGVIGRFWRIQSLRADVIPRRRIISGLMCWRHRTFHVMMPDEREAVASTP